MKEKLEEAKELNADLYTYKEVTAYIRLRCASDVNKEWVAEMILPRQDRELKTRALINKADKVLDLLQGSYQVVECYYDNPRKLGESRKFKTLNSRDTTQVGADIVLFGAYYLNPEATLATLTEFDFKLSEVENYDL